MKPNAKRTAARRAPVQERAQRTVEAILDAVIKLLKRGGASSSSSLITTNQIAETAGVSIGSLYQYFPNKRAIFTALHERHIGQVDRIMQRRMAESAEATLEELIAS
jgi:AcrR family transcriptional regulator